jgi:hemerythrin-like metal-binding protein
MMKLTWDEHFSVGVVTMDKQHQVIFDHMSAVSSALEEEAPRSRSALLLETFDIYCKMHFFEEERLMDEMQYPALAGHRRQHDLFVSNLEGFMEQKHQRLDDFLAIRDWFLRHIIQEDIPYGTFRRDHPLGG